MTDRDESPPSFADAAALVSIVAIAAIVRVYELGARPLWLDEAMSIHFASHSLGVIPFIDTIPPLYYYLLHFWLRLGDGEAVVRSLSVLFSTATVPLVYGLGRTLGGARVGWLAALLFALAPFQVRYAQEARTYALLTFAAAAATWGLAWIALHLERAASVTIQVFPGNPRRATATSVADVARAPDRAARLAWLAFVVGTATMLHCHYTSVLFVAAANAAMWILLVMGDARQAGLWRRWIAAQAAAFLLWLPIFPLFVRASLLTARSFWIAPIDVAYVVETVRSIHLARYVTVLQPAVDAALLAMAAVGAWAWRHDRRRLSVCLCVLLVPLLLDIGLSLYRPILLAQTLVWTGVPFLVLTANGAMSLGGRARPIAAAALLVAVGIAGLVGYHEHERKEAWDEAAAYVAEHVRPDDVVVFVAGYVDAPFEYYFRRYESDVERYPTPYRGVTRTSTEALVEDLRGNAHVWLVSSHAEYADPEGLTLDALRGWGRIRDRRTFYGVDVLSFAKR